jgi:uncharacterized membrane protein
MRPRAYALILALAALGLRLWRLDAALWYDEAFSAWLAQLPLERLLTATLGDVHPPTYYLLLWAVQRVLGDSEAVLRLPSVLAGLGLVYLAARIGHRLGLPSAAVWLAVGLTAFSPFQIYYSQEARNYALLSLSVAIAALGLIERRWWLAVTGSAAALYLHNIAPLFLAGVWLAGFITLSRNGLRPALKLSLPPALATLIIYLPGLAWLVHQTRSVGSGYWIPSPSSPGSLLAAFDDLLFFTPQNPFVIATALVTALGLILIVTDLVQRVTHRAVTPGYLFCLLAVTLPAAMIVLVSLLWQPVLVSRVMAPIAPFYYLLLAWSVTKTRRRLIAWLTLAGPVAAVITVTTMVGLVGRQTFDPELYSFYGRYQPGDGLYHANVGSYVIWHYYRPDVPQYLWPQETTLSQTLTTQTKTAMGMREANFEEIRGQAGRWWLIYFHNPTTDPAEIDYVEHLVNDYPSTRIKQLRSDATVEAWLVLIEPNY